jgi:predicted nucleotidyltransferase
LQLLHKYISSSLLLNQFNDLNLPKFNLMITKENILSLLKKHKEELLKLGVSDIGLFGSYVFDKQTDKSDIDLLIDFEPERENFDNYMAVYDIFENLFKDEKIEIVTKNGLSKHIGPKILNNVIYV